MGKIITLVAFLFITNVVFNAQAAQGVEPESSAATSSTSYSLDIDGDGQVQPLTDGLLILRYLFNFTGDTLIAGAVEPSCTRCTSAGIQSYILSGVDSLVLDIDDDGKVEPLTDGLLILRYLFNFSGETLISQAVQQEGGRTGATEIGTYLATLVEGVDTSAPITLGATSQIAGSTSTISFTHTLSSGSNRAVVVGVSIEADGLIGRSSNITYGGVTMHPVPNSFASLQSGSFSISTELFYLLSAELPLSGDQVIAILHNGSDISAGAIQLAGVAQESPEAVATNALANPSTISTSITTLTDNALLLDVVGGGNRDDVLEANSTQTSFWGALASSSKGSGSTREVGTAGSYTQQWNTSGMNRVAHSVVAFAPVQGVSINLPPVLNSIGNQSVQERATKVITLTASDAEGDALSFTSSALPSYATLTNNGNNTATLTLAPQVGNAGSDNIVIQVTDNFHAPVEETIVVEITEFTPSIIINEFLADNATSLVDGNGKNSDWIELYNPTGSNIDISGWCLTDDITEPQQWCFPTATTLAANNYLIVFASKADPAPQGEFHAQLKLSKGGEYLALLTPQAAIADDFSPVFPPQVEDISYGRNTAGDLRYFSTLTPGAVNSGGFAGLLLFDSNKLSVNTSGTSQVNLSTTSGSPIPYSLVSDASWLTTSVAGTTGNPIDISVDTAGLAAGEYTGIITATASDHIATTLTVTLTVGTAPARQGVIINEILAGNENTNYDTDHYQFSDWIELYNNTAQSIDISGYYLSDDPALPEMWQVPSNTVISAGGYLLVWADKTDHKDNELHTNFKLSSKGETVTLADQNGAVLDTLTYSKLDSDISVSKVGVGIVYMTPTPGVTNATSHATSDRSVDATFSVDEGFYAGTQTVVLAQENGGQIYYTTDGAVPTQTSTLYTQALQVSATAVIRAIAFEDGKLPSKVETKTYFIGEESTMPVVSLGINRAYLFDDVIGIYVEGTNGADSVRCDDFHTISNFNQDWERPVSIEYFNALNQKEFGIKAGLSISGQCSRYNGKKSFSLELDSKYGDKSLKYSLYPSKPDVTKVKDFKLRNSLTPSDVLSNLLVVDGQFNIDYQAHRAVRVFMNGIYWGVYNIREKKGVDYLQSNYPDLGDVDIIAIQKTVKTGDDIAFRQLDDYIDSHDLSKEADYQGLLGMIDEDNYIDYMVLMMYSGNSDWIGNNTRWWREKKEGAVWRWMLDDLDGGFLDSSFNSFNFLADDPRNYVFMLNMYRGLITNSTFKAKFKSRFNQHLDTTFESGRVIALINQISTERMGYGDGRIGERFFDDRIEKLKVFAEKRVAIVKAQLKDL